MFWCVSDNVRHGSRYYSSIEKEGAHVKRRGFRVCWYVAEIHILLGLGCRWSWSWKTCDTRVTVPCVWRGSLRDAAGCCTYRSPFFSVAVGLCADRRYDIHSSVRFCCPFSLVLLARIPAFGWSCVTWFPTLSCGARVSG